MRFQDAGSHRVNIYAEIMPYRRKYSRRAGIFSTSLTSGGGGDYISGIPHSDI
jgi:hypothetical protein